jgi:hypothetical protein
MPTHLAHPVALAGRLEPGLTRGLWLIKWLLVVPHAVVLFFLWVAAGVLTVVAWFVILFTGRYPRSIFDFNLGVLRWSWRVFFYSYGALGTDRYPPFTLGEAPDYPARLDIAYPEHLSRGLVLVKTWLLGIPHYLVLGFFLGGGVVAASTDDSRPAWPWSVGLVGLLVVIAGVVLLFTSHYPRSIFDLVMGMDRWAARVAAYALLMTDEYPPFRLDQGGDELTPVEPMPGSPGHHGLAKEPPGADPARRWTPLRAISFAFGSIALALAVGIGIAGGALLFADKQLRDSDGFLMTGGERFTTSTYAVVSDDVHLDGGSVIHKVVGDVKLTVRGADQPVILGIAATDQVESYLDGVAHVVVTDMHDGTPVYRDMTGGPPRDGPTDASFWKARVVGRGTQTLHWDASEGDWSVVLMNADGSAMVSAEVAAGATLPVLGWGAATLLTTAVILFIGGLVIVLIALPRAPGRPEPTSPQTPAPPGPSRAVQ